MDGEQQRSELTRLVVTLRAFLDEAGDDSPAARAAAEAMRRLERFVEACHVDNLVFCVACHTTFEVPPAQRAWYAERKLSPPKRCPRCRAARRQRRQEAPQSTADGITPA